MRSRLPAVRQHGTLVVLRLLGQSLEFAAWVVAARRLPGEALGHLVVAFLLCRYGGVLVDWGAKYVGVRELAAGAPPQSLQPLIRRRQRLMVAVGAVYAVSVVAVEYAVLLPLLLVIAQQGLNRDWMALGQRRMVTASVPAVAQGAVLLALALAVPPTTASFAVALACSYGAALAVSLALNRMPRGEAPAGAEVGGWMATATLADQAVAILDACLLALLVTPDDAGMYATVQRLPNAWLAVVGLISTSCMPSVVAMLADREKGLAHLRPRLWKLAAVVGSATLVGAPLVALVVPVLFGPRYREAAAAAAVLVVSSAVMTLVSAVIPACTAVLPDRRYAFAQLSTLIVNLALNVALIPAFGMLGAAIAKLGAQTLLLAILVAGLGLRGPRPSAGGGAKRVPAASLGSALSHGTRLLWLAVPAALGCLIALVPTGYLLATVLTVVLVVLTAPPIRRAVLRVESLPLLLSAPAAASVYPAMAVPVTTLILLTMWMLLGRAHRRPPLREGAGILLAGVGLVLPLATAVVVGNPPVYIVGDALQYLVFYLALLLARGHDVGLLSRRSLWGLFAAVLAISVANALGRVDFLAAEGSDVRRNINFVAPVLLLWSLTDLLWNGVSRRAVLWFSSAGVLVLAGFTRGMWAGAVVGVLVIATLYLARQDLRLAKARRITAILGLCAVAVVAVRAMAPEFAELATQKATSLTQRNTDFTYQQRSFESIAVLAQLDDPVRGEGWGATYMMPEGGNVTAGLSHYIHNQYVAHVFRTGWAGCVAALLSVILLTRVRRGLPGSAAAAGTLAYVVVTGWTSPALYTYPTNLLAGLAVGAAPVIDAVWRRGGACERSRQARRSADGPAPGSRRAARDGVAAQQSPPPPRVPVS
ncbi:O-antigen/teichoic acid export membrane protein [Kineococcus xinjiangensis]|uniref:O-antigen/teichoic acid export membrane protein n=1 Tax=Kineococcus xinjiangensis TaxID=512762 RepID=A0A2S6II44_9ACTN|nr:hypothetical protein [Kineococcus xinjiangensis]PPK93894.1 O-antigen/teichoic acid export membrane protein [Kineococcus xinjiangensis]